MLFPPLIWVLLLITGMFQALYYVSLAGAYQSGDMSLAYPLARSSPVIVIMIVTFILGQGEMLSKYCVIGILLVVAGCFMLPMTHFSDFRLKNYTSLTCRLALLAAVGTAGYTVVDAEALAAIKKPLGGTNSVTILTALYALTEALASSLWLIFYVAGRKTERTRLLHLLKTEKRAAILAGMGIYLTYTLVLLSMSWARNVSYVAGFRQLSIPVGVMMSAIFLKEPISKPKAIGVAILLAGLILIAAG